MFLRLGSIMDGESISFSFEFNLNAKLGRKMTLPYLVLKHLRHQRRESMCWPSLSVGAQ